MEMGNEMERSQWFPDIGPLFKLLSYENVPPYLKGALRNAIATFVPISPAMKDKVWSLLEQYDLPVVATPLLSNSSMQPLPSQVYDMTFELNEVEARQEEYPSTLSYLKLLNVLIAQESHTTDKGSRYIGIFRFVRDQVFAPHSQRAYADPVEKWELVAAALRHFQM
jgi:nuclear pore complex protein Nup205